MKPKDRPSRMKGQRMKQAGRALGTIVLFGILSLLLLFATYGGR